MDRCVSVKWCSHAAFVKLRAIGLANNSAQRDFSAKLVQEVRQGAIRNSDFKTIIGRSYFKSARNEKGTASDSYRSFFLIAGGLLNTSMILLKWCFGGWTM